MSKFVNTIVVTVEKNFADDFKGWMLADQMPAVEATVFKPKARLIELEIPDEENRPRMIIQYEFKNREDYNAYVAGIGREMVERFKHKTEGKVTIFLRSPGLALETEYAPSHQ